MTRGYFMPVLHAHLPYVRHPEHEFFLEENWLYEAAADCYIPLIRMLRRLADDGVGFGLTLSLSPTLLEMLSDSLLRERLGRHLERLVSLSEAEAGRTASDPATGPVAAMYADRYRHALREYEELNGDLVAAFRRLAAFPGLELITTSATHAFLPNLRPVPGAVRAQVEGGMRVFERHMGRRPRGFWLPECGYFPGLDSTLSASGAGYFFLETHGILHASPRPMHGIYRPVACPSGAVAFGRDPFAAERVWCAERGYPADPAYRDFFRDIGFEEAHLHVMEHLSPLVHDDSRAFTGLKYMRITGPGPDKETYVPLEAMERAMVHARDFVEALASHASGIEGRYGFVPLVTAPYDAELFGHWWFEGITWLEEVLRLTASEDSGVRCITPSEYIAENGGDIQPAEPPLSSWGQGGYSALWIESDGGVSAARLLSASERMRRLLKSAAAKGDSRVLDQAMRELMLAQASDWVFMMHKGSHKEYARGRMEGHLAAFEELLKMAESGSAREDRLNELRSIHPLMPGEGSELFPP